MDTRVSETATLEAEPVAVAAVPPPEEAAFVAVPVPTRPPETAETATPREFTEAPDSAPHAVIEPESQLSSAAAPAAAPRISRLPRFSITGLFYNTVDYLLAVVNAPFVRLKPSLRAAVGGSAAATMAVTGAALALQPLFPPRDAYSFPHEQRLLLEQRAAEAAEAAKQAQTPADGHGKPAADAHASGHSKPAADSHGAGHAKPAAEKKKAGTPGKAAGHAATSDAHSSKPSPPGAAGHGAPAADPHGKPAAKSKRPAGKPKKDSKPAPSAH
ncbi:hypothetical protein RAS1_18550 [Phycisphaerae bacterium RAS1]|nr:hypothetical protein RAS1_18550 [Phycisphaerae bacterium RAS1]